MFGTLLLRGTLLSVFGRAVLLYCTLSNTNKTCQLCPYSGVQNDSRLFLHRVYPSEEHGHMISLEFANYPQEPVGRGYISTEMCAFSVFRWLKHYVSVYMSDEDRFVRELGQHYQEHCT